MKKLACIFYLVTPISLRVCEELQDYFDTEFWYYTSTGTRPEWWSSTLNEKCKVLDHVYFKKRAKFFTLSHIKRLNEFDPDIVMLPGFAAPANYLAYRWAKKRGKRVIVFTERSRDKHGNLRGYGLVWKILRFLYRDIDLVMVATEDSVSQFRDVFRFGSKVVRSQYGILVEDYLLHPLREIREKVTVIFPNRLVNIYNPILAIEIIAEVIKIHPNVVLKMNAVGPLRELCERRIADLGVENHVHFLDDIKSWKDLGEVYRQCDIMILPALFSNGNRTIFEAMSSGMGIVISNKVLGDSGKAIVNNMNGFNLEPVKEDFVGAIRAYIENPALLKLHGEINKSRLKEFGPAETARLYHRLIHEHIQ